MPSRKKLRSADLLNRYKLDVAPLAYRLKLDAGVLVIPGVADEFRIVLFLSFPDLADCRLKADFFCSVSVRFNHGLPASSQNATALAAAAFNESTSWNIGIITL